MKKHWKIIFLVIFAILFLLLHQSNPIQVDFLLNWKPENPLLASAVLLLIFTVKSATVFIPLRPLQILSGHFLPGPAALLVNLIGQVIVASIPFWIGKKAGQEKIRALLEKYPKAKVILTFQNRNPFATSFFPRACAFPLGDLVTMYLGATGIPYRCNVTGSVLGCFPSMLLSTFLGASIQDPDSPEFWVALISNIAWIALSALVFYLYRKHNPQKEVTS